MAESLYQTLGLQSSASADDIRKAYRKLAKKFHPDLNPGNKEAEKKFKELNTANEILGDPEKKAKYDRGEIDESGAEIRPQGQYQYHQSADPSAGHRYYYQTQDEGGRYSSAFEGFGADIFEQLFRQRGSAEEGPRRQADELYLLEVDFRDAALGAERDMTLPTGKTVKVKIPAGVESGKRLRLRGLAGSGENAGDVYIELRVKPSKLFNRMEKNIELEVPITFYEAALGGEIRVPTLEKPIMLKVPPHSNTGTKLKVKGKGIGGKTESERGDLIVNLKVVMPTKAENDLKKFAEDYSKEHSYNPRELLERDASAE